MNANPYEQYRQTAVETASPERLIIMLYDGAVKFINQAKISMNEGNIEETNKALFKTQDIISELMIGLNMEAGEIAQNLYNLYDYFQRRLVEANTKKDAGILDEVLGHLMELRETWAEAAAKLKASPGAATGVNIEG
jgi:flagellar protein FliS